MGLKNDNRELRQDVADLRKMIEKLCANFDIKTTDADSARVRTKRKTRFMKLKAVALLKEGGRARELNLREETQEATAAERDSQNSTGADAMARSKPPAVTVDPNGDFE